MSALVALWAISKVCRAMRVAEPSLRLWSQSAGLGSLAGPGLSKDGSRASALVATPFAGGQPDPAWPAHPDLILSGLEYQGMTGRVSGRDLWMWFLIAAAMQAAHPYPGVTRTAVERLGPGVLHELGRFAEAGRIPARNPVGYSDRAASHLGPCLVGMNVRGYLFGAPSRAVQVRCPSSGPRNRAAMHSGLVGQHAPVSLMPPARRQKSEMHLQGSRPQNAGRRRRFHLQAGM